MSSAGPSSSGGGDGSHYGPPSGAQDNPSYQNYLANQVLASMKSSSAGHMDSGSYGGRPYAPDDRTSTSIECSEKLGSLLDVIDSTKSYSSDPKNSSSSAADLSSPYDWIKHYDTTHSQFYYYNYKTGVSQWEEPEGFIEPVIVTPPKPIASDGSISGEASKGYAATFNAKTGAFSTAGGSTYWDTVGRPNDREGRQMAGPNSSRFISLPPPLSLTCFFICFSFF
jgi:hypothetical protein